MGDPPYNSGWHPGMRYATTIAKRLWAKGISDFLSGQNKCMRVAESARISPPAFPHWATLLTLLLTDHEAIR